MYCANDVSSDWLQARLQRAGSTWSYFESDPCSYWHKPSAGLKCNTDATIFSDINAISCEAIGLCEAMSWICEAGFVNVMFKSDAKQVIDAINKLEDNITEFGSIIGQFQLILNQETTYSVGHVRRQAN